MDSGDFEDLLKNDEVGLDPPKAPAGTIGFSANLRSKAMAGVGIPAGTLRTAGEGEGVVSPNEALPAPALVSSCLPAPEKLGDISEDRPAPTFSHILSLRPAPDLGIFCSPLGATSSGNNTSFSNS